MATVLASFMSGLALGSWLFGRRADRSDNPLRLYGRIEIGIAVAALLVPLFVLAGRALFLRIAPGLEGSDLFVPIRYAIAFLTLLLPTTLMGGTFPIMSRVVVRETDMVGRAVGLLYFLNTGGAVIGVLAIARSRRSDPLLYCRRIESVGITPDSLRSAVAVIRDAWELEREAITLAKNGRRGEAERSWQEALRTDPENRGIAHLYADHILDTAISHAHQGSLESMVPLFRKMADLLPWSADPRFRLGNHLLRENRIIEAVIEYEAGLKIDPTNEAVRARLAGAKKKLQR